MSGCSQEVQWQQIRLGQSCTVEHVIALCLQVLVVCASPFVPLASASNSRVMFPSALSNYRLHGSGGLQHSKWTHLLSRFSLLLSNAHVTLRPSINSSRRTSTTYEAFATPRMLMPPPPLEPCPRMLIPSVSRDMRSASPRLGLGSSNS